MTFFNVLLLLCLLLAVFYVGMKMGRWPRD